MGLEINMGRARVGVDQECRTRLRAGLHAVCGEAWEEASHAVASRLTASFSRPQSRKPDPSFPVAIYTPSSKRRHATLQLLDYNIAVSLAV